MGGRVESDGRYRWQVSSPNVGWNGAKAQRRTPPQGSQRLTCWLRMTQSPRTHESPTDVGQAGQPGPSCRTHSFSGLAAGDGTPAGTGRPAGVDGDQCIRQISLQESTWGRSHRMPSCATKALAPFQCRSRSRVHGHWKALHGDGTHGSAVPLLRCSRRGHPTFMHLLQGRKAGEPAPAASPRDISRA